MQKAIIHTDTRVVKRLTIDENPQMTIDESIVEVDDSFDLALEPGVTAWKVDIDGNKIPATDKDQEDAKLEHKEYEKQVLLQTNLLASVDTILADDKVLPSLKSFFTIYKDLHSV